MDQSRSKSDRFRRENFQIKVILGLQRPQKALLFNKIPNVGLLLFIDPSVVIVQVLTIRTVFSAQRSGALHIAGGGSGGAIHSPVCWSAVADCAPPALCPCS